ncbi:PadR family transcriptional regulator [Streptomyces orinoci]|uniref:PadR family transcriptional regulator n=1 Tax=Streptomyces orinoci TaxID=67339 RepID=UPI0030C8B477
MTGASPGGGEAPQRCGSSSGARYGCTSCTTLSPGTLYPTLHRLEADGLLVSEQRVVDGRTRRVYRATPAGRKALAEDRKALREPAREVLGDDTPA